MEKMLDKINFKVMMRAHCEGCCDHPDSTRMHEWGTRFSDHAKFKQCIKCYKVTEVDELPKG